MNQFIERIEVISVETVIALGNYGRKARFRALIEGARALGYEVVSVIDNDLLKIARVLEQKKVAFAFTFGQRTPEAFSLGYLNGFGIPVLCVEMGYFKRCTGPDDEIGYNQLGINKICWVSNDYGSIRFHELGIEVKPRRAPNKKALILGQVPGDTQHGLTPNYLKSWLLYQCGLLRAMGYSLRYRPHPKSLKALTFEKWAFDSVSNSRNISLEQDLEEPSTVVTFNSTAGLAALAEGLHVICSETAHYHGLDCRHTILSHFYRLANSQWTCAELASGLAIRQTLSKEAYVTSA